ncbi:hypothetical protein ACET8H_20320 [Aeromonas veronii]
MAKQVTPQCCHLLK